MGDKERVVITDILVVKKIFRDKIIETENPSMVYTLSGCRIEGCIFIGSFRFPGCEMKNCSGYDPSNTNTKLVMWKV